MVRRIITCRIDKYLWFSVCMKQARKSAHTPNEQNQQQTSGHEQEQQFSNVNEKQLFCLPDTQTEPIYTAFSRGPYFARFTLIDTSSHTEYEWIYIFFFLSCCLRRCDRCRCRQCRRCLSFPFSFLCFVVSREQLAPASTQTAYSIIFSAPFFGTSGMMAGGMLYGFFVCVSGNRYGTRKRNAHRRIHKAS